MKDVSMNVFPNESYPHCWSLLVRPPILLKCRTFSLKWDPLNSFWNFVFLEILSRECRRNKTFTKLLNVLLLSLPRSTFFSVFFALDLSLCSQILLRHFPWRNFRNLPLLGSWNYQVALIDHDASLRTLRIAHLRRDECLHDEDELVVPYSKKKFIRFPWSIVCRNLTFPLLRRPNTVIIQFWITCRGEFIRLPWSIICNNICPRILISVPRTMASSHWDSS